jgi:hypothetical protein
MKPLEGAVPKMAEFRRDQRIPYASLVFISWKTFDGQRNHVLGRSLDVSARGIAVTLAIRIPVSSFVKIRAYGLNLDGSATVRHVTRWPAGYVLGLELSAPLDPEVLEQLGVLQAEMATP